ncbi:hypothetical protein Cgig2_020160 [Carnegiea gigantea]|uniref:Reverse transcriptase zinc-binding domain-containing protein n=1 Tax=Carnegiea gigantea TaxID=171969 RepID=A0A9Q1QPL1_9CARY|nr:hypothetical protein Cgig2_020160 [Carnegiea gigantea]
MKKDNLWVKWVHGKYLRETSWWIYQFPPDCNWYWKKVVQTKELIKSAPYIRQAPGEHAFLIKRAYLWLLGDRPRPSWCPLLWNRTALPRHIFTSWLFFHQRLPVRARLARIYASTTEIMCGICGQEEETLDHLFLSCDWARDFWNLASQWWPILQFDASYESLLNAMKKAKGNRRHRHITYALIEAAIYQIWRAQSSSQPPQYSSKRRISSYSEYFI